MVKFLVSFILIFTSVSSYSQDSCRLRISLITCSPGGELYSTFGHTAVRVTDFARGTDHVYNYGTFEFGPDFYSEFIRGKLLYFLSVEEYEDFYFQYQYESRSIREQVVLFNCQEKENLLHALNENAKEENRYYKYDFLFDNCTTRAGKIIAENSDTPVHFMNILPEDIPTFRDLLHVYLDAGNQHWSKLGIDILLGVDLDKKVTNQQAMFLPDYLLMGFDSARMGDRPLASPAQTLLAMPSPLDERSIFTPLIIFSLLALLVIFISFSSAKWALVAVRVFDVVFFLLLGLAGWLILFMWLGTDHIVCRNNFNLLWALPTHVVPAFFIHGKRKWVRSYFQVVFFLTLALIIAFFFLPQQINTAILPLLLIILVRSWKIFKPVTYANSRNKI